MTVLAPDRIPLVAAAVAMLVLAILVVWVDWARRANRAFAAFLSARACVLLTAAFDFGPAWVRFSVYIFPYFLMTAVVATVYFASIYPVRRGPLGGRVGGWVALACGLVFNGAYLLKPSLFHSFEQGSTNVGFLQAASGLVFTGWGPLAVVGYSIFPLLGFMAVVYARDYTHSTRGSQRTSHFLVASGFILSGLFDGSRHVYNLVSLLRHPEGFPFAPWGWAVPFLPALTIIFAVAGVLIVVIHRFPRGEAEHLAETRMYAAAAVALGTGLLPIVLEPGSTFSSNPATLIFIGVWRLALPVLVSYALLRYALFDLDLKVRAALAGTVGALAFAIVYFVVSELLENVVGSKFGFFGGFAVAIAFFIAARPMERAGNKVAGFLMPNTKIVNRLKGDQAAETYRQEFLLMQEDGVVTKKERRALELLRERLGIDRSRAKEIEGAALGKAGTKVRPKGKKSRAPV